MHKCRTVLSLGRPEDALSMHAPPRRSAKVIHHSLNHHHSL